MFRATLALGLAGALPLSIAFAQETDTETVQLSAEQMLALVDRAASSNDLALAERLLEALVHDRNVRVRNEARFRLAMLNANRGDRRAAAVFLREILDEDPGAQRVRLELARVLSEIGDLAGARRELRQAQAGGLPADVARVVDRFSTALRERRRYGGHLEVAIAPDSNINRATTSDTLGTVIGDFVLDDGAKARSGIGLAVHGEAFARRPPGSRAQVVLQGSFGGNFYGEGQFNDVSARLAAGPELQLRGGRLQALGSLQRRWFGGKRFSDSGALGLEWERPLGRTAQLRVSGEISHTDVRPNPLQDATSFVVTASWEQALSQRTGIRASVSAARQSARDPVYSIWSGQIGVFAWREIGRSTFLAGASYARLGADERLLIYPNRREDEALRATVGATLRQFTVNGFAPQLRVTWERNYSTIEIYDYSRLRSEFGIVRAF